MSSISRKSKRNLAVLILIGGKSVRLGSDKGIFEYRGKSLISYQLDALNQRHYDIFLVANSKQQVQTYIERIDIKKIMAFIIDDYSILLDKSLRTPMIGLYSGFKELDLLGYRKAFALSCDLPLINLEVIKFLIEKSKRYDCCIPKWNNGFLEPLFAIYPVKKALFKAQKNLNKKTYKLTNILDYNWKINYISVENSIQPFDKNLSSFIHINEPLDLEKLIIKS